MIVPLQQSRNALANQGILLLNVLRTVRPEQWRQPSRLPGWSLHVLVAHTLRGPRGLADYPSRPLGDGVLQDAVSYWRFEGAAVADDISDRAIQTAAQQPTTTLVADFEKAIADAIRALDTLPPETLIQSANGPIRLDDFALTRVLELTIHAQDITESLGLPPAIDPLVMGLCEALLVELGAGPRLPGMSDAAYLDAAAGRHRVPEIAVPSAFR